MPKQIADRMDTQFLHPGRGLVTNSGQGSDRLF